MLHLSLKLLVQIPGSKVARCREVVASVVAGKRPWLLHGTTEICQWSREHFFFRHTCQSHIGVGTTRSQLCSGIESLAHSHQIDVGLPVGGCVGNVRQDGCKVKVKVKAKKAAIPIFGRHKSDVNAKTSKQ